MSHYFWQIIAWCLGAIRQQTIIWTSVNLSPIQPSDIHLRTISKEIHPSPVTEIGLKITCLKFYSNFPLAKTNWPLVILHGVIELAMVLSMLTMMTSSNGDILRITGPLWGELTGRWWITPHIDQWRWALMFSFICAWTNCRANNPDASDLRCHHAHYDINGSYDI